MPHPISRRALIEMSVAGAAALAGGEAKAVERPELPASDKVGFAVVGLGKLALGQIIPALRKTKSARLAALVSGHRDKALKVAAAEGLKPDAVYSYADFDRIANDPRVQVVYVVLPDSLHAEYTIRAFKAGKHVLCEKPMAPTIAECEAMIAAGKAADRKLMIAYRCHYEPKNLEAMRRVRSGSIGKPRLVVTNMGRQADPNDPSDAWRLDSKMSGGGALTDMGVYGVNAARYLLNEEPVEVRAWSVTDPADTRFRTLADMHGWQFRFPSGAIANGFSSFNCSATMAWEVIGEKARLVGDPGCFYGGNHVRLVDGGSSNELKIDEIDQFGREMDWMADAVRGKVPLVSSGEEGLQDVRLMDAIMRSAHTGQTIAIDWTYRRAVDPAAVVDRVG